MLRQLKTIFAAVVFWGVVSQSWAQLGLPPVVLTPLVDQKVIPGAVAQFSVDVAVSLTPLTYQWQFKGKDIAGATSKTYFRTNVLPSDTGTYSVKISNAAGTVTSSAVLSLDNTSVRISSAILNTKGLSLKASGPSKASYVVEKSADLKTWIPISTNQVIAGLLEITLGNETIEPSESRFYRIRAK